MSGIKNLVQAENGGLEEPTNEELCEEGTAGADTDE